MVTRHAHVRFDTRFIAESAPGPVGDIWLHKGGARLIRRQMVLVFEPDSAYIYPYFRAAIRAFTGSQAVSIHAAGYVHPTLRRRGDRALSLRRARAVLRTVSKRQRGDAKTMTVARGRRTAVPTRCREYRNRCVVLTVTHWAPRARAASARRGMTLPVDASSSVRSHGAVVTFRDLDQDGK